MKIVEVRKLNKNSKYTYEVCIPASIVKALKFKVRQKLMITGDTNTGKIVIEDWASQK